MNEKNPRRVVCKNCHHTFEGNFCNQCGQSAHTHEIDFHSIVHEIQHSLFHVDKGILFTTYCLLKQPGKTIRDYLAGKRVQHFKPLAYLFILSTLYAVLTKISNKSTFLTSFLEGFYNGSNDEESRNSLGFLGDALVWMSSHYAYTTLLLLPIFSLASYWCFKRSGYNYFQHLILNCYVSGFRTAILLVLLPLTSFIQDKQINEFIDIAKIYAGLALTFWMYFSFFQSYHPIKKILLTVLTYVVMILLLFAVVFFCGMITGLSPD